MAQQRQAIAHESSEAKILRGVWRTPKGTAKDVFVYAGENGLILLGPGGYAVDLYHKDMHAIIALWQQEFPQAVREPEATPPASNNGKHKEATYEPVENEDAQAEGSEVASA